MRVVVTIATIPTREDSVVETIRSIQCGSYIPDAIYVNIPKWYIRFNQAPDQLLIPKLERMGVIVNILDEDRGCLNKFWKTIELETDPETLIVMIDDDAWYSPLFLHGLIKGYEEFKCAVSYTGLVYPEKIVEQTGRLFYAVCYGHGAAADMLEGVFGVLFPRRAMDSFYKFEPMTSGSVDLYISDDYVIGRHFDKVGVDKRVVCFQNLGRFGDDWSTLWKYNSDKTSKGISSDGMTLSRYISTGKILKSKGFNI